MRVWMAVAIGFGAVACGEDAPEDDTANCGSELTCADDEFCLAYGAQGEEEFTCELFPAGCDNYDDMCDGVCIDDWALEICPDALSFGCVSIGGSDQSYCED